MMEMSEVYPIFSLEIMLYLHLMQEPSSGAAKYQRERGLYQTKMLTASILIRRLESCEVYISTAAPLLDLFVP